MAGLGHAAVRRFLDQKRIVSEEWAAAKRIRGGQRRLSRPGLAQAVGGTGRASELSKIVVAGKTGTAEHFRKESDAWFTCFAPFDDPEIVVTVVVEEGGHGGATAAPIARQVLEYFFQDRLGIEDRFADASS